MNLIELKVAVNNAIQNALDYGELPTDVKVSIQAEEKWKSVSIWSSDVELLYDCDGNVSGCVIVGEEGGRS